MRELADRGGRHAGLAFRPLERARLDRIAVGFEAAGGTLDERLVRQAGVDDLATDRVGQRDIRADVEAQPQVCPLGRAGASRIDGDEPGAVAHTAQQVMEEDRVRLAGIATPQEHEIRVLDLTI